MDDDEENYRYFGAPLRAAGAKEESSFRDAMAAGLRSEGLRSALRGDEWEPQAFRSSRGSRATVQQRVQDFMDEDELEEYNGSALQVAGDYDALGARSLDAARRGARREAEARHPELPVLLDDELVGSGAEPVGLLLLKQLGWYLGKRLGEFVSEKGRKSRLLAEASSGRVAAVRGRHGVGYDGGAVAGLLRRGAVAGPLATVGTDDRRLAFGLGSAHGVEDGGIGGDLVQDDGFFLRGRGIGLDGRPADQRGSLRRAALGDRLLEAGYSFEIADGSDDEAVLGTTAGPGAAAPLLESREAVQRKRDLVPSGFAPEIDLFEFTSPPPIAVPGGWLPRFEDSKRSAARPRSPRWAPPPEDAELRARIDAAALQVARGGEAVERVLRARRGADPGWEFLSADGVGWSYFQSKVRDLRSIELERPTEAPRGPAAQPPAPGVGSPHLPLLPLPSKAIAPRPALDAATGNPMLSESVRGVVASDRASLRASLTTSFVRGGLQGSAGEVQAGLRPGVRSESAGNEQDLSAFPARWVRAEDLSRVGEHRAAERSKQAPARTSREWRPAPLLCKRLGVADPYRGRAPELQMSTARVDYVALPATAQALVRGTSARAEAVGHGPAGRDRAVAPPDSGQRESRDERRPEATPVASSDAAEHPALPGVPPPHSAEDAAAQADAFLASLAPELPPGDVEASAEEAYEPSLDLFQAIFDAASSDSEPEDAGASEGQAAPPAELPGASSADLFGVAKLRADGGVGVAASSPENRAGSPDMASGSERAGRQAMAGSPPVRERDGRSRGGSRSGSHKRRRDGSPTESRRGRSERLGRRDSSDRTRERDRDRDRERGREQGREHDREREREHGRDHGRDRDRDRERYRSSKRDRDKNRSRPSEHGRDEDRSRPSERGRDEDRSRPSERGRDEDRSRPSERGRDEDRSRPSERGRDEDRSRPSERGRDEDRDLSSERGRESARGRPSELERDRGRPSERRRERDRDHFAERRGDRDRDGNGSGRHSDRRGQDI